MYLLCETFLLRFVRTQPLVRGLLAQRQPEAESRSGCWSTQSVGPRSRISAGLRCSFILFASLWPLWRL
jgi:hypothetical protein